MQGMNSKPAISTLPRPKGAKTIMAAARGFKDRAKQIVLGRPRGCRCRRLDAPLSNDPSRGRGGGRKPPPPRVAGEKDFAIDFSAVSTQVINLGKQ